MRNAWLEKSETGMWYLTFGSYDRISEIYSTRYYLGYGNRNYMIEKATLWCSSFPRMNLCLSESVTR